MKTLLYKGVVACTMFIALAQQTAAQEFEHTTARIAAWNLAGFDPIPAERLERQIEGLALLDAEVVALVEVNPIEAIETLRDGLKDKGVCYGSKILRQQGTDLNIGVLFKCGVVAGTPSFIPGTNLEDPGLRQAFKIDMKIGKFDFILIAVHLKSGRSASDERTRDQQGQVIAQFIEQALELGREDILLVGDFNMIPGQDVSNFHHLGGDDVMDFLSSWDLQARFSHILPQGRANLLDGFAMTRTFNREYIRGSLQVFPMHWTLDMGRQSYRDNVSDHLPFVASFRIDADRD